MIDATTVMKFLHLPGGLAFEWYAYLASFVSIATLFLLLALAYKYWENKRKNKNTADATAAKDDTPAAPSAPAPTRSLDPSLLKAVFRRGIRLLKRKSTTRDPIYDIPWLLMVGPPGGGKSTILSSLVTEGMKPDPAMARLSRRAGCDWAFLNGGLVIELAGDYLYEEGDPTSRKTGWGRFLRILKSFRKARPLDGIVLVIPASDLLKRGAHAEVERDLIGRKVLDRLQALQRHLGIRCPIYLLISRCERVDGFSAFARQLPDGAGNDMIGWSNPYSLDANFRDEWFEEAFTSVETSIAELQLATLAGTGLVPKAGELYLFRQNVVTTRPALTAVTSPLFKSTVYLEPFMLRGVYFSGDPEADAPVESDAGPTGTQLVPLLPTPEEGKARAQFIDKLFNGKILPETGLTKLGSRAYASRQRSVRTVQVFYAAIVIALATGMAFATQRLVRASGTLRPVLNSMRGGDAQQVADAGDGTPKTGTARYSRSFTVRLMADMGELAYGRLRSLFLPSSYFSDIDSHIQGAVTRGYERVIFPSFVAELKLRAEAEMAPVPQISLRQVPGATLEQTPAFAELRRRIDALKGLETTAAQYKRFVAAEQKAVAELGALSEKLLESPLPAGFYANFEYHETALIKAVGPDVKAEIFQEEAAKMARTLVQAIYNSIFNATELTDSLRKVEDELGRFSRIQITKQPSNNTVQVMRDLAGAISEAESQARKSRLPMLLGARYEPGEQFDAILRDIDSLAYFPDGLSDELRAMGQKRFDDEYDRLYKTSVKQFDSLLERRLWNSSFGLNARVLMLRDALEALASADYMQVLPPAQLKEAPDDANLTLLWDIELLETARRVTENYDSIQGAGFNSLGPELSKKLTEIAEIHALDYLTGTISKSERIEEIEDSGDGDAGEDTDGLSEWQDRELANFKRAEPLLTPLIAQLDKVGFVDLGRELRKIVFQQGGTLLSFADVALNSARPYGMAQRNFIWWNGEEAPALESFGLTDALELRPFVTMQRQVVRRLSRDRAQPLVALLQGKPLSDILGSPEEAKEIEELLEKWAKVINSLKLQESKQPGNPVDALESFILSDMTKVTLANCFDPSILREAQGEPGEFFGDIRERLRYSIKERCNELAAKQAKLEYDTVRREFEALKDKFPFSMSPFDTDPVKVKRALDLAADFIKKHENTIKENTAFMASENEFVDFMEKIKKINDFFSTTLVVDGQIPSLSFDVAVDFRINKALEVGANQVIDWRLRLARFEADLRGKPEDRYRWGLSDRVEIAFRWAAQAPDQPTREGQPGSARVEGGELSYVYAGPWALLRLLKSHLASKDLLENVAEQPHPLAFRVETERSNVTKDDPDYGQRRTSRLFVRIELYSPVSKARLTLPDFPDCVPDFENPGICEGR